MELLMEHLGKGFVNMLLISMPVVLTAAGIGLVVGILQAVTQVQEQTIAAAPKILGVFLVIIMLGGFFTTTLTEYMIDSFNLALRVIPKQDEYILPASGMYEEKSIFTEEKNYSGAKRPNVNNLMKNSGKLPTGEKRDKQSVTRTDRTPVSQPSFIENKKINSAR